MRWRIAVKRAAAMAMRPLGDDMRRVTVVFVALSCCGLGGSRHAPQPIGQD